MVRESGKTGKRERREKLRKKKKKTKDERTKNFHPMEERKKSESERKKE